MEEKKEKYFQTDNLSLCPFLEMHDLKYIKAELIQKNGGKIKVLFTFFDSEGQGRDLEMEFRRSNEMRYKDCLYFYKNIIHEMLGKKD